MKNQRKMNARQTLNEYCQKAGYNLPDYYHEYTILTITSVYAHFNGEKYAINPCHFNTKKEANEQVAKLILNGLRTREKPIQKLEPKDLVFCIDNSINNETCEKGKKEREKPIVLYSDSSDKPFENILDFLIDYRHSGLRLIGFSKKSIINSKYIAIFDGHTACLDPDHELIWYVAKNIGYLKGKKVHVQCTDEDISKFLVEKLEQEI